MHEAKQDRRIEYAGRENVAPVVLEKVPRLPVHGWTTFGRRRASTYPSLLDSPEKIITRNGRVAIQFALRCLDVGPGDRVLVPTYHCPTMIAPIVRLGASPVFYPIDSAGAARLDFLERLDVSNAKAILAAHYFGFPQKMNLLRAFADRKGLGLIEDCAHMLFGELSDGKVGAFGHYSVGSLPKFFPVPEGGCLVSNIGRLSHRQRRSPGLKSELRTCAAILERSAHFDRLPGLNHCLKLLFAAISRLRRSGGAPIASAQKCSSEKMLESWCTEGFERESSTRIIGWAVALMDRRRVVTARQENYVYLASKLKTLRGARVLLPPPTPQVAPYVLPLWVDFPEPFQRAAKERGLPVFRWQLIWPSTPVIEDDVGLQWADHVLQLPCHQDLSHSDLDWICRTLHDIDADLTDRNTITKIGAIARSNGVRHVAD
ncbi:MAG: DegT/DnrJ/EryC1/StrS family aminotransferase [Burkholderiales bacterium]